MIGAPPGATRRAHAAGDLPGPADSYAKPLSLRDGNRHEVDHDVNQVDHDVASLGGVAGEEPLPVGAVVVTSYRPGAAWRPQRLSPGRR